MPQRTLHMLLAKKIADEIKVIDESRFAFGNLLPDGYADLEDWHITHFERKYKEGGFKYLDFHEFFRAYPEGVMNDDLYLGYYSHILTDTLFRHFLFKEKKMAQEFNKELYHRDYHILNYYITKKYSLPQALEIPDLRGIFLLSDKAIAKFDINKLVYEYNIDISEKYEENPVYVTDKLLDEFVLNKLPILVEEIKSIKYGISQLNPLDYKWEELK